VEATLSDTRPISFRRVDAEQQPQGGAVARPAWLSVPEAPIRPAPFAAADQQGLASEGASAHGQPDARPAAREQPFEARPERRAPSSRDLQPVREPAAYMSEHGVPVRRSSLPPRKSVFPPQVMITRLPPPPPAEVVEEQKPSAEQEAFAQGALELASLRARILSSVESELLSLAVHIAQVIMEREVTHDPSLHQNLARTAVLALGDTQAARLRVSRTAYRAITELYGEAAIDVEGVRVEVSMDATLDALSVIAEGGPSRVDARMDERLTAVLRAVQAEHRRRNALEDEEQS
jgi:Flagellar assembly protein FliH